MVDMITLRSRRSHNGRIGDGGAMVTHNGTCQTCSHADDDQMLGSGYNSSGRGIGKYAGNDRDQNTEGSPAVPEAKAKKHATRKMMAGSILVSPADAPCIRPAT